MGFIFIYFHLKLSTANFLIYTLANILAKENEIFAYFDSFLRFYSQIFKTLFKIDPY